MYFQKGEGTMNDPKDYTKMKPETWKKTVERYREDMLKLAKQNEKYSRPKPMPLPEPPVNPDIDGKLKEEQELQKLFERTKEAREELEKLQREKEELERIIEEQREQIRPRPEPRQNDGVDYWSVENMRRLPNSIPIPENELPFDNSGVVLPPDNQGPNELDNEMIDFDTEPAEWETRNAEETNDFEQPAVFAVENVTENNIETVTDNITEEEMPSTTPEGDRIIRPDYGMTQVDQPVERLEKTPTDMENIPRDRFDTSTLTGKADLIVQVFTARQALPIEGATVTVSRTVNLQGNRDMMAVHITDENGKTPPITLPTPPLYLSETPGYAHPYSEYTVDVKKRGYYENSVRGIQMFDGITTVEPVNLIPLPSGQNSGTEEFDITDYEL